MIELFSKDGLICTVDGECQVQVRKNKADHVIKTTCSKYRQEQIVTALI